MSVALKRLKSGTLDLHREAERHVRILDPDATASTYECYLTRMYGFHAALEAAFAAHHGLAVAGFDAAGRRKQHLLAADLATFGVGVASLPRSPEPPLLTLDHALGAAYVIEGSTLGGAFILSRLQPEICAGATAFLGGYRKETGPMWRRFGAIVEAAAHDLDQLVVAARATFTSLIEWLEERPLAAARPFRGWAAPA